MMAVNVLFAGRRARWPEFEPHLRHAFAEAGIKADLSIQMPPEMVDYIIYAPTGDLQDFRPYKNCKAVLSLWAGVEKIVPNKTLTQPLTRMVDEGLERGMTEWVTGHVLRHHLGMDAHIFGQDGQWRSAVPLLAPDRPVSILGLGALGQACARALVGLGFAVSGWSRSPKNVDGIHCFHGPDGLTEALSTAQILVLLLPQTRATENILNDAALALLPAGAIIINPGRGGLIDDKALLSALDSGQISHATLDVFRQEPLAPEHPYWAHPRVTVTPHIASDTRPETAARVIAENITRSEAGAPLLHLVDRKLGY